MSSLERLIAVGVSEGVNVSMTGTLDVGTVVGTEVCIVWPVFCASGTFRHPEKQRIIPRRRTEREKNTLNCMDKIQNENG